MPAMKRRQVLGGIAAGAGALALRPALAAAKLKHPLNGPLGLELYSLRDMLKKDVPGTLARVKGMGFTDVEVPSLYGKSPEEFASLLKKNGLAPHSTHIQLDRLEKDLPGVIKESKALGVKWVICPWIPHKGKFTAEDARKVIDAFPKFAKALKDDGLSFAYHTHGFEFEPGPDGTLMDTLIKAWPADLVSIEIDVFWVRRGGEDPVKLLERYPGRFPLMHLKDIAKGLDCCHPNGGAPDDTSVALGDGMIDWPGVLRAAAKGGTQLYYIEDEHPDAFKQIPKSLTYLRTLKL